MLQCIPFDVGHPVGQSGHDVGHSEHIISSGGQVRDEVETRRKKNIYTI